MPEQVITPKELKKAEKVEEMYTAYKRQGASPEVALQAAIRFSEMLLDLEEAMTSTQRSRVRERQEREERLIRYHELPWYRRMFTRRPR